jgi:hypothetical protein
MATCPDDPTKTTEWIPAEPGAMSATEPCPPAFVLTVPWFTPSIKMVPVWLAVSRSYKKTKPVPPFGRVAGALIAAGTLTALELLRAVDLATRPLVAPV